MGENKHIEELDFFTKKNIKNIKKETPSLNFTENLMQTILEIENKEVYKPTPLISKKMWFVLAGILLACILYVSRGASLARIKMPTLNLEKYLSKIQVLNIFENIAISSTVLYACFFFTLMIFIQIYFLKNHFTNKLNL